MALEEIHLKYSKVSVHKCTQNNNEDPFYSSRSSRCLLWWTMSNSLNYCQYLLHIAWQAADMFIDTLILLFSHR